MLGVAVSRELDSEKLLRGFYRCCGAHPRARKAPVFFGPFIASVVFFVTGQATKNFRSMSPG